MTVRIEPGDMLEIIPRLIDEGVVVDSVITDPPYHLTARTSRFGKEGSAPPQHGRDGAMGRLSKGFMGKTWDGGDIAFRPETWAAVMTIMRPGAFLLCFGGTRTFHRMFCAIEDAGFVIQDCIQWLYGTGFPKRRDALKPAWEPVCVAYKRGGARTLQVDECRIHTVDTSGRVRHGGGSTWLGSGYSDDKTPLIDGRWPANLCHDGSDEVVSMFPQSKGQLASVRPDSGSGEKTKGIYGKFGHNSDCDPRGDDGSAARFFWSPKANKKDRAGSLHPTVKPVRLLDWLVPLVTPVGGTVFDPFAGSGTTGEAAKNSGRNAILVEREPEYLTDIRRRFGGAAELRAQLTEAMRESLGA